MPLLDRFRLDGKVAVLTGASSGLGVGFATALAEAGADLVLGARRKDRLTDTANAVETLGRRAVLRQTDVASPGDCAALVQAGLDAFGQVNILVNHVGIMTKVPAIRETPEQFHQVIAINLEGAY